MTTTHFSNSHVEHRAEHSVSVDLPAPLSQGKMLPVCRERELRQTFERGEVAGGPKKNGNGKGARSRKITKSKSGGEPPCSTAREETGMEEAWRVVEFVTD